MPLPRRYLYKTRSAERASELMLGLRMEVVPGTRLLCSGFWGVARHVNYVRDRHDPLECIRPPTPHPRKQDIHSSSLPPSLPSPRAALVLFDSHGFGSRQLGEILQATALALPGYLLATAPYYQALPWLYPLYYVALFIPRQIDDDLQLELKYGKTAFKEYTARVPSRILPGIW